MKKIILAFGAIIILSLGCSRQETQQPIVEELSNTNHHLIPLNDALETLNKFLEEESDANVKSTNKPIRVPGETSIVRASDVALVTKSTSVQETTDCDELIYIVNFQNNSGYAILAADDRISARLLMVADSGSLDSEEYCSYLANPVYPIQTKSSGDGFVLYDGSGQPYMNPDALSPYDDETGDSYVGDYDGPINNTGTGGAPIHFIHDFIEHEIGGGGHDGGFPIEDPDVTTIIQTQLGTTVTTQVSPLLTDFISWNQEAPFNNYAPVRNSGHAYAGCVPLAISKILAYHEFPSVITYDGIQVDWTALKDNFSSPSGQSSAAALVKKVADECVSIYFNEGTFTLPLFAKWYLERVSYSNVVYTGYNTQRVLQALDNSCPVFICSVPYNGGLSFDFGKSHGWNIDGYKLLVTITQYDYYENGLYVSTSYSSTTHTMVHCDFGWGGFCNGYFTSGIFNLNNTSYHTQFDNPSNSGDTNYNAYLKTITYSHP